MKLRNLIVSLVLLASAQGVRAQDDLLSMLDSMEVKTKEYTYATFKIVRLVTGHSIEIPGAGEMQLLISHRFGRLNGGPYEFFGLDQANMRLGFEYSLDNRLCVGVGRSNIRKTYDGFLKYKLLRQAKGKNASPVTVAWVSSIQANALKWTEPDRPNFYSSRLSYAHQLLIARKFNDRISLQLMPTMVHRNLVSSVADQNDVYAMGIGGRFKLTGSVTLNAEYYYVLPGYTADNFEDCLSLCFDIETGGHVFQLIFSNSPAMTENMFIAETDGAWQRGDIHFGFNLSRAFMVSEKHRERALSHK
ncbi:MAG: hypothetical protein EAZ89_05710 [Bacteroidetes bacterium]|jgi:Membrane bound beta barrel domain (DUF5777)|nr:MAG: hypothetical protein EAZ89_05710 [Bacteroidota bacterium]